jgi:4a-hydroxytetrahydrobiopterin dehydratase
MEEQARGPYQKLSRREASEAVTGLGWRLVLGELRTEVLTGSLPLAADVAARAATTAGAQGHLRMDVRADRVILSLQSAEVGWVTERDVELARAISTMVGETRLETVSGGDGRAVQVLEVGIDTVDAEAPAFWVLADADGNEACVTTWQGRD